jgi:hypothetical protein
MDQLPFLDKTITLNNGTSFERLEPITDFRQCHGVTPPERRILYRCRRLSPLTPPPSDDKEEETYILKLKIQIPDDTITEPSPNREIPTTFSTSTLRELSALQIFANAQSQHAPRLIASHSLRQNPQGLLPGGYITCTIMTTLPGKSLFDLGYWSLDEDDRVAIQGRFLEALA